MAYKYYASSIPIQTTPKEGYREGLQAVIDVQFDNASNIYTIQEETTFGEMDWQDVDVRITHVLSDKNTGEKLNDDFRNIIFKDITHTYGIGYRYKFDDNIWITTQSDLYKYVTASATVRRCNNVLRWIGDDGSTITEPCIIDYKISDDRNQFDSSIVTAQGNIDIICQYNDFTKTIKPNQRFLFGSRRFAYKVRGDGINNFLNQNTYDDESTPLIKISLDVSQINPETDDLTNGIADAYTYTGAISPTNATAEVIISPNATKIIEGESQTYSVYLYKKNVKQSNIFTYAISGVPESYYEFTSTGNGFTITNNHMYGLGQLTVVCTSGLYSENISIDLGGAW